MDIDVIKEIRNGLKQELENFDGESARLKVRSDIAEAILFNVDEEGKKTFAFPTELMKKVNFDGISFDGFVAIGFDFSEFKGVSLDPQKVYNADLSYAVLNGVTITNTFDDVILDGVNSEGMIYNAFKEKFQNASKTR